MNAHAASIDTSELFLQTGFPDEPPVLEAMVHEPAEGEHHFYLRGLTLRDFATVFRARLGACSIRRDSGESIPADRLASLSGSDSVLEWNAEGFCRWSSERDHFTRVVFQDRDSHRRAIDAALRGFVHRITRVPHIARVGRRTLDRVAHASEGIGFYASPAADVAWNERTIEIACTLARSGWGVIDAAKADSLGEHDRLLIYYDRTSGIWEAVT